MRPLDLTPVTQLGRHSIRKRRYLVAVVERVCVHREWEVAGLVYVGSSGLGIIKKGG